MAVMRLFRRVTVTKGFRQTNLGTARAKAVYLYTLLEIMRCLAAAQKLMV
jgi:hypothetical protein